MPQDIRETLGVCVNSPFWEEALAAAAGMPAIPQWLTEDYISKTDEKYQLLGDKRNLVLDALSRVVKDPVLCTFTKVLYHIIGMKRGYKDAFARFALPESENLVGLFPVLGHITPSCEALRKRNVPEDIICDTLSFFRLNISDCLGQEIPRFGEMEFAYFPIYLYTDNLWIGRLRFEIHPNADRNVSVFADKSGRICILMRDTRLHVSGNRLGAIGFTDEAGSFDADFVETDTYYEGYVVNEKTCLAENTRTRLSKEEWECIFAPGDTLLKVHIPYGGKLTREACDAAYEKARRIYTACYPEHDFRGFICNTWLLCPALLSFLPEHSNIRHFQDSYRIFPAKNTAADVFLYVYGMTVSSANEVDFENLSEDNSMQRGIKKLLLSGEYIHQYNGFIPF